MSKLTPELEAELDKVFVAVTSMFRSKQMEAPIYYKSIISIAYEYAVAGEHLRAASLSQSIPREYFQEQQRQQMTEDPKYAYVAYSLALALFQNGYIHIGPQVQVTMPSASA